MCDAVTFMSLCHWSCIWGNVAYFELLFFPVWRFFFQSVTIEYARWMDWYSSANIWSILPLNLDLGLNIHTTTHWNVHFDCVTCTCGGFPGAEVHVRAITYGTITSPGPIDKFPCCFPHSYVSTTVKFKRKHFSSIRCVCISTTMSKNCGTNF